MGRLLRPAQPSLEMPLKKCNDIQKSHLSWGKNSFSIWLMHYKINPLKSNNYCMPIGGYMHTSMPLAMEIAHTCLLAMAELVNLVLGSVKLHPETWKIVAFFSSIKSKNNIVHQWLPPVVFRYNKANPSCFFEVLFPHFRILFVFFHFLRT